MEAQSSGHSVGDPSHVVMWTQCWRPRSCSNVDLVMEALVMWTMMEAPSCSTVDTVMEAPSCSNVDTVMEAIEVDPVLETQVM